MDLLARRRRHRPVAWNRLSRAARRISPCAPLRSAPCFGTHIASSLLMSSSQVCSFSSALGQNAAPPFSISCPWCARCAPCHGAGQSGPSHRHTAPPSIHGLTVDVPGMAKADYNEVPLRIGPERARQQHAARLGFHRDPAGSSPPPPPAATLARRIPPCPTRSVSAPTARSNWRCASIPNQGVLACSGRVGYNHPV